MTRAAIYARMSTDKQSEASPADQVRECRRFAEAKGWSIAGANRPERPNTHLRLAGYRDPGMVAAALTLNLW